MKFKLPARPPITPFVFVMPLPINSIALYSRGKSSRPIEPGVGVTSIALPSTAIMPCWQHIGHVFILA
jgi:hypothetical protein